MVVSFFICIFVTEKETKMKHKNYKITEKDFLLTNRRASRMEEIEAHGHPITFRRVVFKSKKVYDRNAMKREAFV